jgi:hypothetical protein|tara:strand:- start:50 stop:328 length:279 start_codon:yes stop_codon:yes gene_type:complete
MAKDKKKDAVERFMDKWKRGKAKSENLKVISAKPKPKKIMRTGKCSPGKMLINGKCVNKDKYVIEKLSGMSEKEWIKKNSKKRRQSKTGRQY